MSESILNKTANWFRAVGHVYELALKREPTEIKLFKDGKVTGTTDGERIMGRVSTKDDNGIHTFDVYGQNLTTDKDGNIKEHPQWKMYEAMMDWNPILNGNATEEPTLVNIEGSVEVNDYPNQKGEISTTLRWRVKRANTQVAPDDPTGVTLKATLLIHSIKEEEKNEEKTGRLVLQLYGANKKGECFPVKAFVAEDMADDFVDCYEKDMTVPFEFEAVSRHIGDEVKAGGKTKFGRHGKVAVNSGFDVTELMLVGGDDEIEEPDELTTEDEDGNEIEVKTAWINPEVMKKAIRERNKMLEELLKNGGNKKSSGTTTHNSSLKAKKDANKKTGKFGTTHKVEESDDFDDDDEEMPF